MIKYIFAYRHAVLAGVFSTSVLLLLQYLPLWIGEPALPAWMGLGLLRLLIFCVVLVVWLLVLIRFLGYVERKIGLHRQHLSLLVATIIGCTGLSSLIETRLFLIALSLFTGLCTGLVFVAGIQEAYKERFAAKQWRRIFVMLWSFNVYAAITTLFALALFFQNRSALLFAGCIALVAAYGAFRIWHMYQKQQPQAMLGWTVLLGALMFQLAWVAQVLPFGYLALGLLVTWIWYLLQLLIRFHFSKRGIEWPKQWRFLLSNGILYVLVLFFFIRWI